jgi:hypothetical protein
VSSHSERGILKLVGKGWPTRLGVKPKGWGHPAAFSYIGALALSVGAGAAIPASCSAQATKIQNDNCASYGTARVPKYRVAKTWVTEANDMLVIRVSLDAKDLNQGNLLALVCRLGTQHPGHEALWVQVFDSYAAAREYNELQEGISAKTRRSLRASYGYDRRKATHDLEWRPDPNDEKGWIKISLGKPPERP